MALAPSVKTLFSFGAVELASSDEPGFSEDVPTTIGGRQRIAGTGRPDRSRVSRSRAPSTQVDWTPYVRSAQKLRDELPDILAGHELLAPACAHRALGRSGTGAANRPRATVGGNWSTHLFSAIAQGESRMGPAPRNISTRTRNTNRMARPIGLIACASACSVRKCPSCSAGVVAVPVPARAAPQPTGKKPAAITPQSQSDKQTTDKARNR